MLGNVFRNRKVLPMIHGNCSLHEIAKKICKHSLFLIIGHLLTFMCPMPELLIVKWFVYVDYVTYVVTEYHNFLAICLELRYMELGTSIGCKSKCQIFINLNLRMLGYAFKVGYGYWDTP